MQSSLLDYGYEALATSFLSFMIWGWLASPLHSNLIIPPTVLISVLITAGWLGSPGGAKNFKQIYALVLI